MDGKVRFKQSMFGNVPQYYCTCGNKFGEFCKADHSGEYYPDEYVERLKEAAHNALVYVEFTFCYPGDWTPLMREKFDALKNALEG